MDKTHYHCCNGFASQDVIKYIKGGYTNESGKSR